MKLLLAVCVILLGSTSYAQTQITTPLVSTEATAVKPTDWTVYVENEQVKIEYVFTNCDPSSGFDFEGVMFRLTNKTSSKLVLSWHKILHYAGTCRTCDYPDEYRYEMSMSPNEVLEADCEPQSGYDIKIFSKFIDANYSQGDPLTAFQLDDLSVTQY
ncbi:MAG: hypothetical protein ACFHU9_06570 [Fluviicola sp.]